MICLFEIIQRLHSERDTAKAAMDKPGERLAETTTERDYLHEQLGKIEMPTWGFRRTPTPSRSGSLNCSRLWRISVARSR